MSVDVQKDYSSVVCVGGAAILQSCSVVSVDVQGDYSSAVCEDGAAVLG